METTNTTPTNPTTNKSARGWSLISTLAAFALGWAAAFAALQLWHGKTAHQAAVDSVKPVVNAATVAVDSVKKAMKTGSVPVTETPGVATADKLAGVEKSVTPDTPVMAGKTVAAEDKPVVAEAPKPLTADKSIVVADTGNDEREAIKKMFQRNMETVRVLTAQ